MAAPLGKVGDAARHAVGMQREPKHVDRAGKQLRRRAIRNHPDRSVGGFSWDMIDAGRDEVLGVGLDILVLDHNGRIRVDYQLIEA